MGEQARVRISLSASELEVEGVEEFVAQYAEAINSLIIRLEDQPIQSPTAVQAAPAGASPGAAQAPKEQREFGEVLHSLPSNASGSDRILVAGWYAQKSSADNTFSTGEANQLLLGQGIKLSNASQALKGAISAKRVFKVGSRYRVSRTGEEHLRSLIGS
jgi:hypothetical protein